jgi:TfoX/Sxy family transcriptional regulator of competence genes
MANKKINQLVSKTAILSTDLFGIGDATTGQLFKKTIAELQAAIGGAVISVNGLVGTVVLDTDDIQELASPTNKYFTDARARGAISLTVTGNSGASTYSSGTGVLNVPTYTLAGLGGITATFLSGTSGISYNSSTGVITYSGTVYTDASIRALFSGSTGITYNSSTGAISYNGTVYTDSSIRALISLTTTGTSGASTYNNTTGVINVPNYTLAGLGGISLTSLSGGTGITYNSSTGAISYSGTVYTDASIRALFSASGSVSYNNTTGVISLTGGNLTEATSSVLTITGGSGAVIGGGTSIQVKQATTSVSGFLSSTDWTTFNNKQSTITLTTTGTSGAATFSSNTLNIPNYGSALSGYLPLTGGTLTGALGGTSATFSGIITANSATTASNGSINIESSDPAIRFRVTGGSANKRIYEWRAVAVGGVNDIMQLRLWNDAENSTSTLLSIASTGAAKF